MRRRLSLAFAASLLTAAATLPAAAEPFVVDKRAGEQKYQTVVYNPAGSFFVFWIDERSGTLHGRRWTLKEGAAKVLGARRAYGAASSLGAFQPAAAFDAEGKELLLVWQEDRTQGNVIVGIFVNRKGKATGAPFDISGLTAPECSTLKPGLDYNDSRKTWMVVWSYFLSAGCPPRGIEGREVASDGTLGPLRKVSPTAGDVQSNIAYDTAKKQFLVTWMNGARSLARRLNATGAPKGAVIQIATASEEPNVWYDESREEWLVVYQEDGNGATDRVLGRFVDRLGKAGDPFEIARGAGAGVQAYDPGIAWSGADESFLVTFETDLGAHLDLYGQVVRDGEKSGDPFLIADGPGSQEGNLTRGRHLDCSPLEKLCLVVWESDDHDDGDLYGDFVTLP